jgi:hypothetical protein
MIKCLYVVLLATSVSLLAGCDNNEHPTIPTTPAPSPLPQVPPPSNPTVPNTPGGTTTATNAPQQAH